MNQFQPVVGQRTDRGRTRRRNEDAMGGPPPDLDPNLAKQKGYLYAVADGMGGEAGGQQASTLAMQTLITEYYRDPEPDVGRSLRRAVQVANQRVYREARSTPPLARMGTTLTAAVARAEDLVVAHVGDSRAYLIRNDEIRQLTRDHTWVAEAISAGTISAEEARNHPNRHILTRALGSEPQVNVDLAREKLRPGDRALLCSDGLTNLVGDGEILQHVQRLRPRKASDALVDLANERGGQDNITAMVISVPRGVAARAAARRAAAPPAPPSGGRKAYVPMLGGLGALLLVAVLVFGIGHFGRGPATSVPPGTVPREAVVATTTQATATPTLIATPPIPTSTPTTTPPIPAPTLTATRTPTVTPRSTPTLTATPTPIATPTATRVATSTATQTPTPVQTLITPKEPAKDSTHSDPVTFRWEWPGGLADGEEYDVKVCKGEGCRPQNGMFNTSEDTTWEDWCPKWVWGTYPNQEPVEHGDVLRWKVEVIDSKTEQPTGPESEVWWFTWVGGCDGEEEDGTGGGDDVKDNS